MRKIGLMLPIRSSIYYHHHSILFHFFVLVSGVTVHTYMRMKFDSVYCLGLSIHEQKKTSLQILSNRYPMASGMEVEEKKKIKINFRLKMFVRVNLYGE